MKGAAQRFKLLDDVWLLRTCVIVGSPCGDIGSTVLSVHGSCW
jgi:hypothetical protein